MHRRNRLHFPTSSEAIGGDPTPSSTVAGVPPGRGGHRRHAFNGWTDPIHWKPTPHDNGDASNLKNSK